MNLFIGGLIVWLVTTILVEGKIFEPLRDRMPERFKLDYLVRCHLCCGTWVGIALGVLYPYPGLSRWVVSGLAYKAVAHVILTAVNVANHLGNALEFAVPTYITEDERARLLQQVGGE